MNSRLERLKKTIEKCEKVDLIFAKHRVRGQEPEFYDDLVAGFGSVKRSGFDVGWTLVFGQPVHSRPEAEKRNREPTYLEFRLSSDEADGRLFEIIYLPAVGQWTFSALERVGGDGTEPIRNLAADCQIGANEWRQIGEDEAMKLIETIIAFYMNQPAD